MQRYTRTIKDAEAKDALTFVFDNAFGNPVVFDAAPTAGQMKANSWGKFGTDLYVKFGDSVVLKFTGTVVS